MVFASRITPFVLLLPLLAPMQSVGRGQDAASSPVDEVALESGRRLWLFPTTDFYPRYAADPQRTAFAVRQLMFSETDIADSSDDRFGLMLGGRLGLLRNHPAGSPQKGWQLNLDVGINAQFDNGHNQDNVGWDGKYGLTVTTRATPALAFKAALLHTSSHIGDEYAERTGRLRIGYTREELALAVAWFAQPSWNAYAEYGYAYLLSKPDLQERGRIQSGVQWEDPGRFWGGRVGWYAAFDASATEERDWRLDTGAQLGLLVHSDGRIWRAALEFYDGRPPIGEFFQETERYTAIGFWLDL